MIAPSARKTAFLILQDVLEKHHSLDRAFEQYLEHPLRETAWIKALCFGILKKRSLLDFLLAKFSKKPISQKDRALTWIIYIGLYQLFFMETKPHAATFETVALCKQVGFSHASGFVNALLQNSVRSGMPTFPPYALYNHPDWLLHQFKQAYPEAWPEICEANNAHPPFYLRVNLRKIQREAYLDLLKHSEIKAIATPLSPCGIALLDATDVKQLPHFLEGYISVQDLAAQQAAPLLELKAGQIVLDACAAPGGKTAHILETADVSLYAVDQDAIRLARVSENLTRLNLHATLRAEDATQLDFPARYFDRILLDAPCSGTGVIRRHPDIRFLRQASDIPKLASLQQKMLTHLWPMLKPEGILLYATCSLLPDENDAVIEAFLATVPQASTCALHFKSGHATRYGWQFLPSAAGPDGFYYSKLVHTSVFRQNEHFPAPLDFKGL